MKLRIFSLTASILLAACSAQSPEPAPVAAVADKPVEDIECKDAGYQLLPAGMQVPFAHHLRADHVFTVKTNGQLRRRVALEFLEGNGESVLSSVDQAMLASGYKTRVRKTQPNGDIVIQYVKKGQGNISVTLVSKMAGNPNHPDTKGVLIYGYPLSTPAAQVKQAPKPAAAG